MNYKEKHKLPIGYALQGRLIQAQESFQDLDEGIKLNALRELIKTGITNPQLNTKRL